MNNKESSECSFDGKCVHRHFVHHCDLPTEDLSGKSIALHCKDRTQSSPAKSDEGLRQEIATVIWDTGASYFTGDEVDASVDKILALIAGKDELSKVEGWQGTIVNDEQIEAVREAKKAGYEAGCTSGYNKAKIEDAHSLLEQAETYKRLGMQKVVEWMRSNTKPTRYKSGQFSFIFKEDGWYKFLQDNNLKGAN